MERIVYKKTLDVHKNGIQFTLQGFETADNMARRIEISLMASGDTIDFPLEQIVAMMYVTTPNATEPSINECTIKDNTIIYDVLPIVEEGITEMQLKLIETRLDGATSVLATPRFALEVSKSNTDDEGATQSTTFTALEDAIAKANGVYESRLTRIELDSDCMFKAYYADGTTYETDLLKNLFLKNEALLSQSYARGGTGTRAGEDTDNSMYYSNVSRSASEEASRISETATDLLEESTKQVVYTAFSVDFETGEMKYISPCYSFDVNEETGNLDVQGEIYEPTEVIDKLVTDWLTEKTTSVDTAVATANEAKTTAENAMAQAENANNNALIADGFAHDANNRADEAYDLADVANNRAATLEIVMVTEQGRIDNANIAIEELNTKLDAIADYPIEIGYVEASGDTPAFHYKKMNSGEMEIWGIVTIAYNGTAFYKWCSGLPFASITCATANVASSNTTSGKSLTGATADIFVFEDLNVDMRINPDVDNEYSGDSAALSFLIKGTWK